MSSQPEIYRLERCSWRAAQLGQALQALGVRAGASAAPAGVETAPLDDADGTRIHEWLCDAADLAHLEAEALGISHAEAEAALKRAVPSIWTLSGAAGSRFLVVLGVRGRRLSLLTPERRVAHVPSECVRAALCAKLEAPYAKAVEAMLDASRLCVRRRSAVRRVLLQQILGGFLLERVWLLRAHPNSRFWAQLVSRGVPALMARVALAHLAAYALVLGGWKVIADHALSGRSDRGWLILWGLLLCTSVPLRIVEGWARGRLGVEVSRLFKQRLLVGALQTPIDQVRREGAGTLLGHVIESETLQQLLTTGGFSVFIALVELCALTLVLAGGAGGFAHGGLLAFWIVAAGAVALGLYQLRRVWSDSRLGLTGDLVEKMIGHRTRLVQVSPSSWHSGEDAALASYLGLSRRLDALTASLFSLLSRGWLVAAVATLLPILTTKQTSAAQLAPALGATWLAAGALTRLVSGLSALIDAAVAWRSIAPIFEAARQCEPHGTPELLHEAVRREPVPPAGAGESARAEHPLLEARRITYRHASRGEPVLQACSFAIARGDNVLLEGASGAGKSSLAALIAGLRSPDAGNIALRGVDYRTLGARAWRRHIVLAPQFQENLILTGTLAFNLLLGRQDTSEHDLVDARQICEELGLGELLDTMPSGLLQPVGESGWQLSHGEKSRIFIGRALLQRADLIVLDESFAALDPHNLSRALDCVRRRASTLLVVAHP